MPQVTEDADAAGGGRLARLSNRRLGAVAAALVIALGGLIFGGWVLFRQHQKDEAASEALAAARNYVVKLTNLDSEAVDARFADILDGSTGEFKDSYGKSNQQLRQQLIDRQVHTRGSVVEAAVKSATPDKVVVLMFVDESVSNRDSTRSELDHSRIKMTMVKVDGRWVARKVQLL
ncbi:hypothetical protein [Mycobacterium simiae]|uniref:hypothetical protein n=1 Tax=Mycobacterium simiae TaxID=1784 RepID=UPI00358F93EA